MQSQNNFTENTVNNNAAATTTAVIGDGTTEAGEGSATSAVKTEDLTKDLAKLFLDEHQTQQPQHADENQQLQNHHEYDEDYVLIQPAKIWTRPDIEEFKVEVSAGDGDGVITIGHGDTVTVSLYVVLQISFGIYG